MSMFEPVVLTEAAESGSTSMAWRCTVCARIYLYEIEVEGQSIAKDVRPLSSWRPASSVLRTVRRAT